MDCALHHTCEPPDLILRDEFWTDRHAARARSIARARSFHIPRYACVQRVIRRSPGRLAPGRFCPVFSTSRAVWYDVKVNTNDDKGISEQLW